MVDGAGGGGADRPSVSQHSDGGGLDGPDDSLFEVLKPALVLVGMLVVFFLLMYFFG